MKLGHFSVSFEDLSIPVAGLPVSVTRTYDTRQRGSNLDFGYGWSVGYQNVRIQESRRPGFAWNLNVYPSGPLGLIPNWCVESALGNVVSVTLADGKVEKFRAKASPACNQGEPILDVEIVFEAMEGTHSKLRALDHAHGRIINGSLADPGDPANPLDPNRYLLTTPEGREFTLDQGFTVREVLEREGGNTITFDDNGIIHSSGLSVVFVRDAQNRITEVHAPDGTVLHYEYDALGNLSAFVDATGSRTTYTYLARGGHYLEEIIDPRGVHVARNEYDDDGRLVAVIDADGHRIEYDHDIDGRAETIRDRRGITTVYVYNDRGDVLAETNGAGETTLRSYDDNGNQLSETNALGETHSWTYDQLGNVLTETNAAGETVTNTYGPFNQLNTQTDALGHAALTNEYLNYVVAGVPIYPGPLSRITDANGNVTRFGYDTAGQLNALTDPSGAVSRMTYDAGGFLVARIEADGSRTDIVNDVMGRALSETRTRTRADGSLQTLRTEYTLDAKGRVTATQHPDGTTTRTDYDANDKPVSECDALNRCTTMHYDDQGRLDRTDYADGSSESIEFDANGNVIAQTDRAGRITRMVYDAANRPTETVYPDATPGDDSDNPRSTTGYDAAGRVLVSTDENGNATRYEYDAAGRRTATVMAAVNGSVARMVTTYDAAGRRTSSTDAEGHSTGYVYDAAGRLTATVYDDGNASIVEYDAAGRKTADIDPDGRRTEYAYDANGRLEVVRLAAGMSEQTTTSYAYDEVGNKIRQTDAEGRVTRWEYDSMGREIARVLPEGQRESKSWNAAGELDSSTDFNGQITRYHYDVTGRLASIDYPHDADVSFTYNAAGERTAVLDGRGSSTVSYDARGRVLQSLDADGGAIEYQYDAAGNLLARISPSQSLVYAYDARNRLDTVTRTIDGEAPSVTRYTYDEDGNRTTMIGGDGTQTEYGYDSRHRLRSLIKRTAASALLLAMNYSVDATGLRTHIEESDPAGIVRTVDYQYDGLKRLTDETIDHREDLNDRSSHWVYDRVGNRLQQLVSIGGLAPNSTDYSYDGNDRLGTSTTDGEVTSYTYDANGNTTSKTQAGDLTTYTYNDANRLIQASTASGTTTYVYNADGLRTRQTHTPTGGTESTTWYVQDSAYPYAQVIEEYQSQASGPKTLSATYTFADDLVSQTRYDSTGSPTTSYIQADGFGSTRWLTDAAGTITDSIDYDAFGVEIRRSGTAEIEHLYRGERFDPNLAMYDLRARMYEPANGRFLTQDDFAGFGMDPRSLHKYGYTHNDPINNVDASGHTSLISLGTAINIVGIGSTTIHAGFRIAEGDYQGAAKEVARDAVYWALGAGAGRLIAPLGRSAMALFSRSFFVPLEQGLARSGAVLTRNMNAVMARAGLSKPFGWQAHHIVGEAYAEGKAAMDILRKFKIDVNSPLNGVFLPGCGASGNTGIIGLAVHCGKHVQRYEQYLLAELQAARSESDIINILARIRSELTHGELFLNSRGNL
jgi:RHS repeat-associated protein